MGVMRRHVSARTLASVSGEAPSDVGARARRRLAELVERGTAEAETARRRWSAVDAAFDTHERDRRMVGSALAGAVAFRLFVYLLPLFLAVVTVLGIVVGLDEDAPSQLSERLGLSRYVAGSVTDAVQESHRSLWVLVPLTAWAVYSGGVGAAKVLHAVHALAWGRPVERLRRGWMAALVTFGLALLVALTVAGLQALREESEGIGVAFAVAQVVLLTGIALAAHLMLPRDPAAHWVDLLPGALLAGAGMWVLHLLGAYVLAPRIAHASELYGPLGAAAALLAWLYILGRLLVAAPILNSTLWERRSSTTQEG